MTNQVGWETHPDWCSCRSCLSLRLKEAEMWRNIGEDAVDSLAEINDMVGRAYKLTVNEADEDAE